MKKNHFLLFCLVCCIFCSCSFINLNKTTSELSIHLPQKSSSRAISYDEENENKVILNENGTLNLDNIDLYEISLTPENGDVISKTADAGTDSVTFTNIEVGKYTISFNAYAYGKENKKILIAKNRNPIEVNVVANETAQADIKAEFLKFGFDIRENYSIPGGSKIPLIQDYDNVVPLNQIYSFEIIQTPELENSIELTNDGFIIPVGIGDTYVKYTRYIDDYEGRFSVEVYPIVKINLYSEGILITSLEEFTSTFSITDPIKNWYFDEACTEPVPTNDSNQINIEEIFNELYENNQPFAELNFYAGITPIDITDSQQFINALTYGGEYIIDGENIGSIITISDEINVTKNVTITFKNNITVKREEGYYSTMLNTKNDINSGTYGSIIIKPDVSTPDSTFTFDGTITDGNASSKIMELASSGDSSFTNVIFTNNVYVENYAYPSAILIGGTGENTFKNCKVTNNSISGETSRAPGIKIERGTNTIIDTMEFSNNTCSSYSYGLDIWIEDASANLTLKGKITNEEGISLHYKKNGYTTVSPINVSELDSDSSDFHITLGDYGEDTITPNDIEIENYSFFDFGDNAETLIDKFTLWDTTTSPPAALDGYTFNDAGYIIEN